VVASRIAPFTDYLAETDVSWADPESAASIAQALAHAIATRDAQRIAASSARLSRRFSWTASAERHAALYRAHLKEKHPCP
jgi:glycosyltransferase involved in cell wall biosynthesis